MFGVILWSDPVTGSAVIWCEDQGDLAYFDPQHKHAVGETPLLHRVFQSGDLVQFDTVTDRGQTLATNLSDVDPSSTEVLVHGMPARADHIGVALRQDILPDKDADVIDFAAHKTGPRRSIFASGVSRRG